MFAIGIGTRFQLRLNTSRGGGGKSVSNPAVRSITPSCQSPRQPRRSQSRPSQEGTQGEQETNQTYLVGEGEVAEEEEKQKEEKKKKKKKQNTG